MSSLLTAMQLADSAFPSGMYTLSHGLEGYTQAKAITAETLPALLDDLLLHSIGPGDLTALVLANRGESLTEIENALHATVLVAEMRAASIRTGRQLLDTARHAFGGPTIGELHELVAAKRLRGMQPVISGVVHRALGVDARQAATGAAFGFASSFVGAALRLRVVDHRVAQTVLNGSFSSIERAVEEALTRTVDEIGGCVPLAEVMSSNHERADARLFAT